MSKINEFTSIKNYKNFIAITAPDHQISLKTVVAYESINMTVRSLVRIGSMDELNPSKQSLSDFEPVNFDICSVR